MFTLDPREATRTRIEPRPIASGATASIDTVEPGSPTIRIVPRAPRNVSTTVPCPVTVSALGRSPRESPTILIEVVKGPAALAPPATPAASTSDPPTDSRRTCLLKAEPSSRRESGDSGPNRTAQGLSPDYRAARELRSGPV